MRKSTPILATLSLLASTAAFAQQPAPLSPSSPMQRAAPAAVNAPVATNAGALTTIPANSSTVTTFYKQNVYDQSNSKIGEIADVLVSKDGQITGFVVGAGGWLGMGAHDVAVAFDAIKVTQKNDKPYLVMNTTKDALKAAPGFKYDRTALAWVPENAKPSSTTGQR
jgi:sporulation protein YlmC with PRC-barrel domain